VDAGPRPPRPAGRRRAGLIGLAAFGIVLLAAAAVWQVSRDRCFTLVGEITCRVATDRPRVALTFDDGPTPLGVEAVAPILARHGVRATFFLVGEALEARPDLARRLAAEDHEIANHSYSHQRMIGRPAAWHRSEIARTQALLEAAGGRSRLFRAPYGKKLIGLPLAVEAEGLRMVAWDVEEPATADPVAYARQIVDQARPGSILLMHPMHGANATARDALPLVLAGLKAKGLEVVPAGELLAD
jgi:peptidoglycan/xylan/chitin deacetylase (PgdA/CDA1 family)